MKAIEKTPNNHDKFLWASICGNWDVEMMQNSLYIDIVIHLNLVVDCTVENP